MGGMSCLQIVDDCMEFSSSDVFSKDKTAYTKALEHLTKPNCMCSVSVH